MLKETMGGLSFVRSQRLDLEAGWQDQKKGRIETWNTFEIQIWLWISSVLDPKSTNYDVMGIEPMNIAQPANKKRAEECCIFLDVSGIFPP